MSRDGLLEGDGGNDGDSGPAIPFPFEPYEVQKQLMCKIYNTLERGGIGIFESPTGTGKSLSVICSALQWLKDAETRDVDGKAPTNDGTDSGNKESGGNDGKHTNSFSQSKPAVGGDADLGGARASSWLDAYSKAKGQREREDRACRIRHRRKELDARLAAAREEQRISDLGRKSSHLMGRSSGDAFLNGARGGLGNRRASTGIRAGGGVGAGIKRPLPKNSSSSAAEKRNVGDGVPEDDFLVEHYHSDAEPSASAPRGLDSSSDEEEEKRSSGKWRGGQEEDWEDLGLRQILYCSRTHSQTSQFVNEVKKTTFADGVRCASLGSRRTLCGNEAVSSLRSDAKMTDACLELQKNRKKKEGKKTPPKSGENRKGAAGSRGKKSRAVGSSGSAARSPRNPHCGKDEGRYSEGESRESESEEATTEGCPLLTAEGQREFPYRALASVRDIEELAGLGKREGTCAYYGARKAAALAQLVVMPYAALLSRETRAALGVRLSGAVVIIDEAHNLVEAINSVHSKRLSLSEVSRAHSQLAQYEAKYGSRLKGKNAFYVGNILRLLRSVLKLLKNGEKNMDQLRAKTAAGSGAAVKNAPISSKAPSRAAPGAQGRSHGPGIPCGVARSIGRVTGAPGGGLGCEGTREGEDEDARSEMLEVNDFLFRAGVDNLNIFKLLGYMRKSEVARKVMGFMDHAAKSLPEVTVRTKPSAVEVESGGGQGSGGTGEARGARDAFVSKNISALQNVEGFLNALTNSTRDGRVLVAYGGKRSAGHSRPPQHRQQQDDEEPSVKFLMLNPSVHFDEIVGKARAVVLVGGTMQPTGDLVRQLFSFVEPSRVDVFSCGHVIPKENLLPLCVSRGPSGQTFNFTFHRRGTDEQIDELGRLMVNACKLVPGGVVCFVASYGYLDQVLQRWKASGAFRQLVKLKAIFSEPRSAKDVDAVLHDFSLAARAGAHKPDNSNITNSSWNGTGGGVGGGGALLMSVVGAKMSEGINFSDDLARCVVMVGLPYPDKRDPELKQKMAYLDGTDPTSRGRAGREYYNNICMRAVNQSIGRSIRHAGDYASILLVDERYHDEQVVRLLPGWIAERVIKPANFGGSFVALRKFFVEMHARRA